MKFKILKSFVLSGVASGAVFSSVLFAISGQFNETQPIPTAPVKSSTQQIQDITYSADTVYVTDELFNAGLPGVAGGVYFPHTNTIKITYTLPQTHNEKIIKWCESNNNLNQTVLRHEREHARKMLLVKRDENYDPMTRARLAAMNEIMAPGAEIIEAADHHRAHGDRIHPLPTQVYVADSLIQKRMNETQPLNRYVDYTDPEVASYVLHYATDKFVRSIKRGTYKHTIKRAIDAPQTNKYPANTECNFMDAATFAPQTGDWTELFKYKTTGSYCIEASIWKYAKQEEKERTLHLVDSIINTVNPAAKYMIIAEHSKTR